MHENDRSATGFLPPSEFESVADEFFAKPEVRVRGWEPAIDAQARIRSEVDAVLARTLPRIWRSLGTVASELYCPCHLLAFQSAA